MNSTEALLRKTLVASGLDTAEWSRIDAGLRDRAFFMSEVENVRILSAARNEVAAILQSGKSMSEARRDLRAALQADGYVPAAEDAGTIKDLYSKQRLDVMLKTNVEQARGYADYLQATSAGALAAFPAYEFIRVYQRKAPRGDWRQRWDSAARAVGWQGVARGTSRMVALKTSPVWAKLSRFGNPFPPFDFGSGMGLEDVDLVECRKLGLGPEAKAQKPPRVDFNGSLQAELPALADSPDAERLRAAFGDQVTFDGNVARWRGNLIRDTLDGQRAQADIGTGFDGQPLTVFHSDLSDALSRSASSDLRDSLPLSPADFDLLPSLWRRPDRVDRTAADRTRLELDMLDGYLLSLLVDPLTAKLLNFWKTKN